MEKPSVEPKYQVVECREGGWDLMRNGVMVLHFKDKRQAAAVVGLLVETFEDGCREGQRGR